MQFKHRRYAVSILFLVVSFVSSAAENGYNLWLRYVAIPDTVLRNQYRTSAAQIVVQGSSATLTAVSNELKRGFDGLLAMNIPLSTSITMDGAVVAGTAQSSSIISGLGLSLNADKEAYRILTTTISGKRTIVVASSGETGVLYGVFHLLRLMQTDKSISVIDISESPKIKRRLLNHWDNISGSIERGYAGNSLWNWGQLPGTVSSRYQDYARACASIGINGAVLNNVNNSSNGQILSTAYISKISALAGVFRPYGIKVYVSAYFNAPQELGGLSTSDPLNAQVISWWAAKANEIYTAIPDFGGFLVKANSEGQPGPKTYGRTHAQGANCLADALAPHNGVVIWRAFVYDDAIDTDRMKRAYKEFKALDGQFRRNVIIQAKNGPFDFQPREPIHPLFGGLANTPVGMEFQITLEYLGQSVHLVYMGPYWKEVLDFDTYAAGAGSTVGKVVDGTVYADTETCIAGVANTGSDSTWCGHHFLQANWFAYGRLAWNHDLSSDSIADDWARMTWGNSPSVVSTVTAMMAGSREACVNYMTPLGLCGIFNHTTHYGPDPSWSGDATHADWNSVYWHKADAAGVGFDRTSATGSNFTGQYFPTVRDRFNNIATTPPEYLAAFHHVSWSYIIPSTGRTFWNELCYRYCIGCQYVAALITEWNSLAGQIDAARFAAVSAKLTAHQTNANSWRTTCTAYFQGFSKMTVPSCASSAVTMTHQPAYRRDPGLTIGQTLKIYDMQGKLAGTLPVKNSVFPYSLIRKKLRPGIYVVKQGASAPFKMMVTRGH
jgi:alpha-glucuronidase